MAVLVTPPIGVASGGGAIRPYHRTDPAPREWRSYTARGKTLTPLPKIGYQTQSDTKATGKSSALGRTDEDHAVDLPRELAGEGVAKLARM